MPFPNTAKLQSDPSADGAPHIRSIHRLFIWQCDLTGKHARRRWLLGLLVLQSTSSFVLDSYQELLRNHLVVTLFLTMLVGAGGNAGNQSAI